MVQYRITQSRSGAATLLVVTPGREIPLHSTVDPLRDENLFREQVNPSRYDLVVVLGLGLGYHLAPLVEGSAGYRLIVVIERIEGLVEHLPADTRDFLDRDNVLFIEGSEPSAVQDMLTSHISLETIRGVQVLEHPASIRIFEDYYVRVRASITRLIARKAGSAAARRAFGGRYLKNGLSNLMFLHTCKSVSQLWDHFQGMDAVVATSGPGLEASLVHLRQNREKVIIIAADSALPVLAGAGISPDYCVAIDPQAYIIEHLEGITDNTDLVLGLTAHRGLLPFLRYQRGYKGTVFLSLNSHPLCQIIDELYPGELVHLESHTGNVAGDAVLMALSMGFRRIALTGFDFSFPRRCIYARGTAYQNRYSRFMNSRFRTVETSNMIYIRQGGASFREEGLLTRRSFLQYRGSLHDLVDRQGENRIFHIINEGLPIEGIRTLTIEEFFQDTGPGDNRNTQRVRARNGETPTVNTSILGSFLLKEEVFSSLLDESLGEKTGEKEIGKYRLLIKRMVGEGT